MTYDVSAPPTLLNTRVCSWGRVFHLHKALCTGFGSAPLKPHFCENDQFQLSFLKFQSTPANIYLLFTYIRAGNYTNF